MKLNILRRIAEIMLGSLTVRRHLPREHGGGVIVTSSRVGGLKYLLKRSGQWDTELLSMTARLVRKGDHVWDVGANVGLFAKAAAHHAGSEGQVICC